MGSAEGGGYLWVGHLRPVQGAGVAAESVLLDVQLLEVFVPLSNLPLDRLPILRLRHHLQLQVRHLLHLNVLKQAHSHLSTRVLIGLGQR